MPQPRHVYDQKVQQANRDADIHLDQMDLFDNMLHAWFDHAPNGAGQGVWVLKGHIEDFSGAMRDLMDEMLRYQENPDIGDMYQVLNDPAADQSAEPPHE